MSEHVHEWEVEYLPDPMSAGSVVRSGDLACVCGARREDTPLRVLTSQHMTVNDKPS